MRARVCVCVCTRARCRRLAAKLTLVEEAAEPSVHPNLFRNVERGCDTWLPVASESVNLWL